VHVYTISSPKVHTTRKGEIILSEGDYRSEQGTTHFRVFLKDHQLHLTRADFASSYKQEAIHEPVHLDIDSSSSFKTFSRTLLAQLPRSVACAAEVCGPYLFAGLKIALASSRAMELMCSAPLLYAMVMHEAVNKCWGMTEIGQIVSSKRGEIIRLIGGVGSKSQVKFLNKITAEPLTASHFTVIETVLKNAFYTTYLAHWDTLSMNTLKFMVTGMSTQELKDLKTLIAPKVMTLDELVELDKTYNRLLNLWRLFKGERPREMSRLCTNAAQVHAACDALITFARLKAHSFAPPPIKAIDGIVPICNEAELTVEGVDMHNCVGSYALRVKSGECYIYRVTYPERATLAVAPDPDDGWRFPHISQLRAACNKSVSNKTRAFVQKWLDAHV